MRTWIQPTTYIWKARCRGKKRLQSQKLAKLKRFRFRDTLKLKAGREMVLDGVCLESPWHPCSDVPGWKHMLNSSEPSQLLRALHHLLSLLMCHQPLMFVPSARSTPATVKLPPRPRLLSMSWCFNQEYRNFAELCLMFLLLISQESLISLMKEQHPGCGGIISPECQETSLWWLLESTDCDGVCIELVKESEQVTLELHSLASDQSGPTYVTLLRLITCLSRWIHQRIPNVKRHMVELILWKIYLGIILCPPFLLWT